MKNKLTLHIDDLEKWNKVKVISRSNLEKLGNHVFEVLQHRERVWETWKDKIRSRSFQGQISKMLEIMFLRSYEIGNVSERPGKTKLGQGQI